MKMGKQYPRRPFIRYIIEVMIMLLCLFGKLKGDQVVVYFWSAKNPWLALAKKKGVGGWGKQGQRLANTEASALRISFVKAAVAEHKPLTALRVCLNVSTEDHLSLNTGHF